MKRFTDSFLEIQLYAGIPGMPSEISKIYVGKDTHRQGVIP